MIDMRWVLTREQVQGAFSEPIEWTDGSTVFARLQFRERRDALVTVDQPWRDIPVVSEISEAPKIALVRPRGH